MKDNLKVIGYALGLAFAWVMVKFASIALSEILDADGNGWAALIVALIGLVFPLALVIYIAIKLLDRYS